MLVSSTIRFAVLAICIFILIVKIIIKSALQVIFFAIFMLIS